MSLFLPLSGQWINIEKIASVEVSKDPAAATHDNVCQVWFCGGGCRDFRGEDATKLLEFLKSHQAK